MNTPMNSMLRLHRRPWMMLMVGLLSFISAHTMWGQAFPTYTFTASTGTQNSMAGAATAIGTNVDDAVSGPFSIGFSFGFNNTTYTQFSIGSNGYIGLGGTNASTVLTSTFNGTSWGVPVICPFSRDFHTAQDGYVQYVTTGVIGSRILTVEFKGHDFPGSGLPSNCLFQVRLYEGSNRFDFWYGMMSSGGASIGAQVNTSNYVSVFCGPPASVSYNTVSNTQNPASNQNIQYAFDLCTVSISGNIAQGGTATMNNFDTLMKNSSVMRGNSGPFTPYTITPSGCAPSANMTYTITGANAADYSIAPSNPSITPGNTSTPVITFSPSGTGQRNAVLTISGPSNFLRTYYLAAKGAPRIQYTGNIPQGGTAAMNSGDQLMSNISIQRLTIGNFTPFTLTNVSANGAAPAALVTYVIKGTSGGQYSISPANAALTAGQTNTPTITFSPTGIGNIVDTLTVTADGEVRVFQLFAFSEAPGLQVKIQGVSVDSSSQEFRNEFSCIGATYVTYQMVVTNIGAGTLTLSSADIFATDTNYREGTPRYPLIPLPGEGAGFRRSTDYVISTQPPVLPLNKNANIFPVSLGRGVSQTLYLSFNAQRRDKRFARLFLHTNAQNITNRNQNGANEAGLLWFDLFGRGVGSHLSDSSTLKTLTAVVFPTVRIGSSIDTFFVFYNSGECDLWLNLKELRFTAGDVDEFQITRMPTGNLDPTGTYLILPPGGSARMYVRFTPHQQGSRRASVRVLTNDSMQVIPGISEGGLYYIDFYGAGKTGLYMKGYSFGQALIGGDATEQRTGIVRLENSRQTPLDITALTIEGTDKTEFKASAAPAWPTTFPTTLAPGQILELGVTFAPAAGGAVGPRNAMVHAVTGDGDIVDGTLDGIAGTRTIAVTPTTLAMGTISINKVTRQHVTIKNDGTMPLKITDIVLSPGTDFRIAPLARLDLVPGQEEVMEVSYAPTSSGSGTGTIDIKSNATNGTQQVQLQALAVKTKGVDVDPTVTNGGDVDPVRTGDAVQKNGVIEFSAAGVSGVRDVDGYALMQSVPNPGRDVVEIGYELPANGMVTLMLYDAQGRAVRTLDAGAREPGSHQLRIDVNGLSAGTYIYRLTVGGHTLSRTLTVVR